jgi:hypothetical protein
MFAKQKHCIGERHGLAQCGDGFYRKLIIVRRPDGCLPIAVEGASGVTAKLPTSDHKKRANHFSCR